MGDEVQRILELARGLGLTKAELARRIGESQQVLNNWRRRGAIPGRKLVKVARALGVTVEELVARKGHGGGQGVKEDPGSYDPDTLRVAQAIQSLSPEDRAHVRAVADAFAKTGRKT